ncbi:MAG: 30S ribosomal protein S17 [Candidatus Kerfeldbacteria bacterium]|nr:30S ribosomal protein S17 [Candidatus Kerfeldbacteria bacterium]
MSTKHSRRRRLMGTVVADRMAKTVVVRIERVKTHPQYRKQFRVSTKLKAHDEQRQFHVGDRVVIEETRPWSKDKRWRVVSRVGGRQEGA